MAAPKRPTRGQTLAAVRNLTTIQGEVLHAANMLQDGFFSVFLYALSLERPDEFGAHQRFFEHAISIWHVVQSDSSQRDMALHAISTVPTKLKLRPIIKRLEWARKTAGTLAAYRNVLAHNPVMFRGVLRDGKIVMDPRFGGVSTKAVHMARLRLTGGLRFWQLVRDDLLRLSDYVSGVAVQIPRLDCARRGVDLVDEPRTSPDRPRLPSLARIRAIDSQLNREAQAVMRQHRRRSSRR